MANDRLHLLCAALLAAWRSGGHPVGVDTHLRVQKLLAELPEDASPSALKTLLAPLLCKDKEDQKNFYALFQRTLDALPAEKKVAPTRWMHWRRLLLILGGLSLLFIVVNKIIAPPAPPEPIKETPAPIVLTPQQVMDYCLTRSDSLLYKAPYLFWRENVAATNTRETCINITGLKVGTDTLQLRLLPRSANTPEKIQKLVVRVVVQGPAPSETQADTNVDFKSYQHRVDLASLVSKRGPQFSLLKSDTGNLPWIVRVAWLVAVIALLLFIALFRNLIRFKKKDPEKEQSGTDDAAFDKSVGKKGPFAFQLQAPGSDHFALDEQAEYIIQMLRRRSEQDALIFDIPKTVASAVRHPGQITFQYRNPTQIDEYLLLIDIRNRNDHRAQVFDLMYRAFVREEVLAERFFYDGDPRLCWNEKFPGGLSLRDLQHKYGEHRLLIIGSGESLFSPVTGRLERWTEVFDQWKHRSFLSSRPIAHWRAQELELDARFRLAPATLGGLGWLADSDAAPDDRDAEYWRHQPAAKDLPPVISDDYSGEAIFALLDAEFTNYVDQKLDDRMLRWVAACAISPVLHWDATLFFGRLVDDNPRYPLLSIANLQKLAQLPWYQQGRMPEKARRVLLAWMAREHPEQLVKLRTAWKNLLEENLARLQAQAQEKQQDRFEDSVAFEELRMQMVVNELALDKLQNKVLPLEKRKELQEELESLSQSAPADFVALELLKDLSAEAEMEILAADKEKLPLLLRGWRWQLPIFLLLALNIWIFDGIGTACSGDRVSYREYSELCLKNPADHAALAEQIICDEIDFDSNYVVRGWAEGMAFFNAVPKEVRSLDDTYYIRQISEAPRDYFSALRKEGLDSTSAYFNIGTALWNAGLRLYKGGKTDSACIYLKPLLQWPLRDAILSETEVRWIDSKCFNDLPLPVNPRERNKKTLPSEKIQKSKPPLTRPNPRTQPLKTLPPNGNTNPGSQTQAPTTTEPDPGSQRQPPVTTDPNPGSQTQPPTTTEQPPVLEQGGGKTDPGFVFSLTGIQSDRQNKMKGSAFTLLTVAFSPGDADPQHKAQYDKAKTPEEQQKAVLDALAVIVRRSTKTFERDFPSKRQSGYSALSEVSVYSEEKTPANFYFGLAAYQYPGKTLDEWVKTRPNSREFLTFMAAFSRKAPSLSAFQFEVELVGYILEKYPNYSPLGSVQRMLIQEKDYPDGAEIESEVQDNSGLSVKYRISGLKPQPRSKN